MTVVFTVLKSLFKLNLFNIFLSFNAFYSMFVTKHNKTICHAINFYQDNAGS